MQSRLVSPLLLLVFIGQVVCDEPLGDKSWQQAVAKAETILFKGCGNSCVAVLHNLLATPELRNTTVDVGGHALHLLADHVLQQANYVESLASSKSTQYNNIKSVSRQPMMLKTKMIMADTPCNSQTLCSIDGLVANKCSYMRKGMQLAYQGLNIAVHVMGVLITVLCGCLFILTQAKCILFMVPPICIRPYTVYSKAFSGSVQMWESVKSMTKTCIMHGSPMVSS